MIVPPINKLHRPANTSLARMSDGKPPPVELYFQSI